MIEQLKEAAEEVHNVLGFGFNEAQYHRALERELSERQIPFHSEGTVPVMYKGAPVGRRRPDMFLVDESNNVIIVELKASSTRGEDQLNEYMQLVGEDSNFGEVTGGAVIRFNEELDVEEFGFDDDR